MKRLLYIIAACICAVMLLSGCSSEAPEQAEQEPSRPSVDTAGLVINEIMSSNSHYIPTQDGEYYDWVELYNGSGQDIDLQDFYFSDSQEDPLRWQFPKVTIPKGEYMIVYLSGLDTWDGAMEIHTNFKLSSSGETLIFSDFSGGVIENITVPALSSNISYGRAEGMPNGFGWFAAPTPGEENSEAAASPEEIQFREYPIVLNEYMSSNSTTLADSKGEYFDWVELYNRSNETIDLAGFTLTDSKYNSGRWTFPAGTSIEAGGYLIVYCSGSEKVSEQGELYAGFALGSRDSWIGLYTPEAQLCSGLNVFKTGDGVSCGLDIEGKQVLFTTPTPGARNADSGYPTDMEISGGSGDGVFISEVVSVSSEKGAYKNDWLELYNPTDSAVNLAGYGLSTKPNSTEYTFPEKTIEAGGYLLVYCTGTSSKSAKTLTAGFKISAAGETLYFTSPTGAILDTFETGKQRNGTSSGRPSDDRTVRRYFSKPTPGAPNPTDAASYPGYAEAPTIETPAGYVSSGTKVKVHVPEGTSVVITTNGSAPESDGKRYTQDFNVTIKKTTVLKAKAFADGLMSSDVVTQTYLVEKKHKISVVSLSSDKKGLFSESSGIMANGPGYSDKLPHYGANFWKDWERSAHIEYYTVEGNKAVEFDCGLHTFGQYARGLPQKGLAMILRETYGANEVCYPFFSDNGVAAYKSLLLRPEGQDWNRAKLRDVLVPALLKNSFMTVDYMDYKPIALYINGEYWGLYYLREKLNENYVVHKYGYEKGKVDLIKGQSMARAGSKTAYKALFKTWLDKNSLKSQKNYDYFCSKVDIDSFIDFWIIETFAANHDTGNIRCYLAENGKWRWMTYDYDWGFMIGYVNKDMIQAHMFDPKGHGAVNNMSNLASRRLLENKDFCNLFVTRYIKALKTNLNYTNSSKTLKALQASIVDEIPRQYDRWKAPNAKLQKNQVDNIDKYLKERPAAIKKQLKSHFKLSESEYKKIWDSVS